MPAAWLNRIVRYADESPESLLANPGNWRIHPKPQQEALAGVLTDVGWIAPVIVNDTTQHVVDGHLRISLAISRGEPTVPVAYVQLSEAEEAEALLTFDPLAAMAVADKAQLDSLLRDVSSGDAAVQAMLADLAKEAGLYLDRPTDAPDAQIDKAEELRVKWGTATGQLWEIPSKSVPGKAHRLLCGDSTKAEDVARLMGGERAIVCLTDPPYSVDYENIERATGGKKGDPTHTRKADGNFYVDSVSAESLLTGFIPLIPSDVLVMTYVFNKHFQALASATAGWEMLYECVWVKETFNQIMGRRYQPQHEPILYFRRKGKTGTWNVPANQSTVFEYPRPKSSPGHPTPRPIEMWSSLVRFQSDSGDVIYEPFSGSGTGHVAAEQESRLCYGLELAPPYVAVALQRLADMGLEPRLASS